MRLNSRIATLFVAGGALVWAGCGGEGGAGGPAAGAEDFCRRVRVAVAAYMDSVEAANPVPDDERYGGTAVVGTIGELTDGMNALVSADYGSQQHQLFVNLMPLIVNDPETLDPLPYLAESWEVNDEETAITFHIRRDVHWHDGMPTDAHDVAFTYLTVTDPRTAFPNAAFWDYYVKGPEGVEVLDDYTVRIRMRPHAEFMDPWRTLAIMPEHLLADVPPEQLKQHPFGTQCPVGDGPFVFVEHRPNDRWVFRANPGFPPALGGRPYLDRYVYRIIPEQTTLLTELLTGGLDVYPAPRSDQAKAILDAPELELRHYPFRNYVFVGWNSRRPQLADRRVRKAMTMGTDRARIVKALLKGYGRVANGTLPPFHWAYEPDSLPQFPYDPDAARALLDDAGWIDRDGDGVRENEDGVRLEVSIKYNQGNQQRQDVAEIMQAQLARIGVEVHPQVVEWGTLLDQIMSPERRDFDGVVMAWVTEFNVDDRDLFDSHRIDQPYAWSGTRNPVLDHYLDTLQLIVDRDKARPVWLAYERALADEHPYTLFYFPDRLDGVNRRLKNVRMDVRGEWVDIKDWWIDPGQRRTR